ncbi:acyltransferase family protein [Streptosporangium sp. LJ11]|uniref:acyltransferase family protein n=1 Tax=Streptosporangium sp. LJ11 TaxID=3436927 RepID=UPI003F78D095
MTHSTHPSGEAVRLPSLTGMRFVAAFLVFACHACVLGFFHQETAASPQTFAFASGWLGVEFFFVLSGFVLTWSAREGRSRTGFWRRRLVKVYPVHMVTWLAALGLAVWAGQAVDLPKLLPSLLLVHTWHPRMDVVITINVVTWSLACDLLFCLAFPLLHALVRRIPARRLWWAAGAVAAVIALLPAVALLTLPGTPRLPGQDMSFVQNWFLVSFPPIRTLDFVLGIVMARIVLMGRWIPLGVGRTWDTPAALGVITVLFGITTAVAWALNRFVEEPAMRAWARPCPARRAAVRRGPRRGREHRHVRAGGRRPGPELSLMPALAVGISREGPRGRRVALAHALVATVPVLLGLVVDPPAVRLPRGLLARAQGRADLRPRRARGPRGPYGELAPVARLARDHLPEREKLQHLVAGEGRHLGVGGVVDVVGVLSAGGVARRRSQGVAHAELVVAGGGGQEREVAFEAVRCEHAPSFSSSQPDVKRA